MQTKFQLDQQILTSLGLDTEKIESHQKKILQALNGELSTTLPILDVCSVQNNAVFSWNDLQDLIQNLSRYSLFRLSFQIKRHEWIQNFIVTCIPAAGAGSRYWKGATSEYLAAYADLPKALLPATLEGDTFLEIKLLEQKKLMRTRANVFIAPYNFGEKFEKLILKSSSDWLVLEQNKKLSTIRFNLDGTPYCNENNIYSPVPAGHGELLHLFDDIAQKFPDARAIHLRNLDNIIGMNEQQIKELSLLAESFCLICSALDIVRSQIKKMIDEPNFTDSTQESLYFSALDFLNSCCPQIIPKMECESIQEWKIALNSLNKPLSVFGVVQKAENDQGGGPVFAQISDGKKTKICLEMTHAHEKDREEYFGARGKLLYFNPVLVFFEIKSKSHQKTDFKILFDDNFWLLTKREHLNLPVCYHETVLYELIGNSEKTNLVFIEVPRTLFKPHKYFADSAGKSRREYNLYHL